MKFTRFEGLVDGGSARLSAGKMRLTAGGLGDHFGHLTSLTLAEGLDDRSFHSELDKIEGKKPHQILLEPG